MGGGNIERRRAKEIGQLAWPEKSTDIRSEIYFVVTGSLGKCVMFACKDLRKEWGVQVGVWC